MIFRDWIGSAWGRFRGEPWGWAVGPIFVLSLTIENLYTLAPDGDYMTAVRLFAASVALISFLYCSLWFIRSLSFLPAVLVILCAGGAWMTIDAIEHATEYSWDLKLTILMFKALTAFAVVSIFLTFDQSQFFQRMTWVCLVGFEGYSFVQYPICKILLGANLDPGQYALWGTELAASACARAEGTIAAYAEVPIIAVLIVMICLWEWRRVRAGQSPSGRS